MNKKLPNVFVNTINKKISNTQDFFYGDIRNDKKLEKSNVPKKINDIFSSVNHVYKSYVKIITSTDIIETYIVGKSQTYLLTLDNKKINIAEIIDIEKI